jgi:hypothetical protein
VALDWAEGIGGLPALIARADSNAAALDRWVRSAGWIEHLAAEPGRPLEHLGLPSVHRPLRCGREQVEAESPRQSARGARRGLRHRCLSRRSAGIADLVRSDRRNFRHRGARPLAGLGMAGGRRMIFTTMAALGRSRTAIAGSAAAGDSGDAGKLPAASSPGADRLGRRRSSATASSMCRVSPPAAAAIFRERGIEVDEKPGLTARRAESDHRRV